MPKEVSAGVLVYRRRGGEPEFLLAHPGGPFWARRDEAAWSIPKGLVEAGEETWTAAAREFREELGQPIEGDPQPLSPCRTRAGKLIHAWLVEADLDLSRLESNSFEMEWPRGSGRMQSFPEVDRARYFGPAEALRKIHLGQKPLILEALARLGSRAPGPRD
ncbi:MAG TPA: NUDIX domain-containing protein [Phenylobacterium sp.]|uniref:NUDIX domain-containing protein n=1 Tax=Phenylobacterium sp. TaxID=1871053 RepID=UPI002BA09066|nr:NUDIX domain-containing protein [Phenylobacterium sp.]HSV02935.1 NUDIX domain-containing protein [Phenylobacterium sp.]